MADESAPQPPPKARGKATRHTAAEIAAMAEVKPEDEGPAKATWHRTAPESYRGLIDATADDEATGDAK